MKYTNTESNFEQNILKKTSSSCGRHWGDLRAQLEVAINEVLDFYKEKNLHYTDLNSEDGSEDFISLGDTAFVINNYFAYEQMTVLVRKHLSIALRNLIQHGLTGGNGSFDHHNSSLAPSNDAVGSLFGLGCFSTKSATPIIKSRPAHVWELILYYYEIKVTITIELTSLLNYFISPEWKQISFYRHPASLAIVWSSGGDRKQNQPKTKSTGRNR